MKILILGSDGFIGSNLVGYLNAKGYDIVKADIHLKEEENYILINPELPDFSNIFSGNEFDVCVNATGAANVQLSFANPGIDYSLNVSNVFQVLDAIRKYNPSCKFINLSSAAVYGNPVELPLTEKAAIKPLSPYGMHKLYSEQICREFYDFFGIPTASLRIFSAYGEGLRKQLFWDLSKKINAGKGVVELFGTGRESRDFIYIKDLVEAIHCVITKGVFDGSVINVASGIESTISDAAFYFVKAFDKQITLRFTGHDKKGDPLNWRADISSLSAMGFKNKYSLEEGIKNYVQWVKGKESE